MTAAVLWGTTGTAQALGPAGTSPETVGALRIAVGALGLVALAGMRRRDSVRGGGGTRRARAGAALGGAASGVRSLPVGAVVVAAIGVAAYQVCFFAGVDRTGVALGTLVAIGSAPVWTGLGAFLLSREPLERGWVIATALAVAGCLLLVLPASTGVVHTGGVVLALGAGASYAAYTLAGKHVLERGFPPTATMALTFAGGAVALSPLLVRADLAWLLTGRGVAMVLWLGFGATALSYALFAHGLARLAPATVATLSLAEPLTAAVLGVAVLQERPGSTGLVGALLLLAGLALVSLRPVLASRRTASHPR